MQTSVQPRHLSINLLPQDPFFETPIGRIMAWASTVGRYLVIFTEVVVIISFASRFKLDRDLTDLNSSITQKSYIVDSYGTLESDVQLIQKKTEFLQQQKGTQDPLSALDVLAKSIPKDVVYTLVQIRAQEIQITGTALTPESLATLVRRLQKQPQTKALYVDQIKSNTQGGAGLEFSIRVQIQPIVGATGGKTS